MPAYNNSPHKLSPKEKKFSDKVVAGASFAAAARQVYNPKNAVNARRLGSQVMARPRVQAYCNSRIQREGLVDASINAYAESFKAVKITRDREGNEIARDINYSARLHAADSISRIAGLTRPNKAGEDNNSTGEAIDITPEKNLTNEEYWNIKFVTANNGRIPDKRELAAFRKKHELQEATEEGSRGEGSPS